jgi:hypothetical protein
MYAFSTRASSPACNLALTSACMPTSRPAQSCSSSREPTPGSIANPSHPTRCSPWLLALAASTSQPSRPRPLGTNRPPASRCERRFTPPQEARLVSVDVGVALPIHNPHDPRPARSGAGLCSAAAPLVCFLLARSHEAAVEGCLPFPPRLALRRRPLALALQCLDRALHPLRIHRCPAALCLTSVLRNHCPSDRPRAQCSSAGPTLSGRTAQHPLSSTSRMTRSHAAASRASSLAFRACASFHDEKANPFPGTAHAREVPLRHDASFHEPQLWSQPQAAAAGRLKQQPRLRCLVVS